MRTSEYLTNTSHKIVVFKWYFPPKKMAGFGCFVFSLSTTVVCLFAFLVMVRRPFYVHHTHVLGPDEGEPKGEIMEDEDEDQELDRKDWSSPPWTLILSKCWMPAATIFCVAVVTNVRTKVWLNTAIVGFNYHPSSADGVPRCRLPGRTGQPSSWITVARGLLLAGHLVRMRNFYITNNFGSCRCLHYYLLY